MKQHARMLLAAPAALATTACDSEALLGSPEQMWIWLAAPLLGSVLVGATLANARRRVRLGPRSPHRKPAKPRVNGILLATIVVAFVAAVAFAGYNVRLEIDPRQKLWNIGLWFLGSTLGTSVALLLGLARGDRPQ